MTEVDCITLKKVFEYGYKIFFNDVIIGCDNLIRVTNIRLIQPGEPFFSSSDVCHIFAFYEDGEFSNLSKERIEKFIIFKEVKIEQLRHHPELGGFV